MFKLVQNESQILAVAKYEEILFPTSITTNFDDPYEKFAEKAYLNKEIKIGNQKDYPY